MEESGKKIVLSLVLSLSKRTVFPICGSRIWIWNFVVLIEPSVCLEKCHYRFLFSSCFLWPWKMHLVSFVATNFLEAATRKLARSRNLIFLCSPEFNSISRSALKICLSRWLNSPFFRIGLESTHFVVLIVLLMSSGPCVARWNHIYTEMFSNIHEFPPI